MDASAGSAGPMGMGPQGIERTEARDVVEELTKYWWVYLITGILWIIAGVVILQFDHRSLTVVGIVIGIMFLVAGLEEFALAALTTSGWKWLWVTFGALLVIGGLWALFNPVHTFLAFANILGFVFALIGVGWMLQAFATMNYSPVWGLGLASGIIMLLLGFWAASQTLPTQAYVLLVFAGIWGLLHGIGDIVKAFVIRRAGDVVETTALA
jgi:uncharacterized membrane protein HdeD (DUF308 family)